jgi:UrcA family protein
MTNPELISLTRAVSYSDLDLSKSTDIAQLAARIGSTARDICWELASRYPRIGSLYVVVDTDCVKKAKADAMERVRATSVAARSRDRKQG